ncbi:MAG: multiheme c-type cytochrome [Candidatus Aminicenantaceae bacterium]
MKKLILLIAVFVVIISFVLFSQEFTYVGANKCKICHKSEKQGKQFLIWEESKHSKSFEALTSEEVKVKVPNAPENPDCLKCHSPLFEKAAELKEEGVACEACHGPGSDYKKLSVMKNREVSIQKGLIVYETPEAKKTLCLTCHEKAHDKPFDFDAAWNKIKHPRPEKE